MVSGLKGEGDHSLVSWEPRGIVYLLGSKRVRRLHNLKITFEELRNEGLSS